MSNHVRATDVVRGTGCRSLTASAAALAVAGALGPLQAQTAGMPILHGGAVLQTTDITTEHGWTAGFAIPLDITPHLGIHAGLDVVRTRVNGRLLVCVLVADTCFDRPARETVAFASLSLRLRPLSLARIRPFAEGGLAIGRSLSHATLGQDREFLAPQFGAGAELGSPVGTWSLGLGWRPLDRWTSGVGVGHQLTLRLGFHPGGQP